MIFWIYALRKNKAYCVHRSEIIDDYTQTTTQENVSKSIYNVSQKAPW